MGHAKGRLIGIYAIRCEVSGNAYVGSSRDVRSRWNAHRSELRSGRHHCLALQFSWVKHGESAFRFEFLEECPEELLLEREQSHLDSGAFVYNSAREVRSPSPLNREIARKHAKEVLCKLEWTEERRAKHSASQRARPPRGPVSEETRAKMSASAKARKGRIGPWTIRKMKGLEPASAGDSAGTNAEDKVSA